jgi:hypothetical protein
MIPIEFNRRVKANGWQHPHPFDILRNGIWFGLNFQTIPTSSNYLLQRRIRPHLIAQHAVNDNISLVGVFVDGHGVKMGKIAISDALLFLKMTEVDENCFQLKVIFNTFNSPQITSLHQKIYHEME